MFEELDKMIFKVCEEEGYTLEEVFDMPSNNELNVRRAEEELEICFPMDYRHFLIKYGSGGLGYFDFMGVEEDKNVASFTVVLLTIKYRNDGLKKNYVAIEYNGDYITCIDCDNGRVVTWSWLGDKRVCNLKENFEEYFMEKLKDYI